MYFVIPLLFINKNKQMNSRSKKYYERKKADDGSMKGSANKEGYNEQNQLNINKPNENPAPSVLEEAVHQKISKKKSE